MKKIMISFLGLNIYIWLPHPQLTFRCVLQGCAAHWPEYGEKRPPWTYRWRPPDSHWIPQSFHCRPQNFIGDPQISIGDPGAFRWRRPYFHWRPYIRSLMRIWGLLQKSGVSNEKFGISNEKFGVSHKKLESSDENLGVSNSTPMMMNLYCSYSLLLSI